MISSGCNPSKDILELQQINACLVDKIAEKERFYESEIKILKEQIRLLQNKLFGRKSEKIESTSDECQLLLFDEVAEDKSQDIDPEDTIDVPGHKRRKRGRKPLPADLPRIEIVHDLSDEEKICFCGCRKMGRKNWLFAGNPEGARASAALFSLVETAKANGLEPYRYLRYLFEKLPMAETTEDYKSLLPQNVSPDQLKLNA